MKEGEHLAKEKVATSKKTTTKKRVTEGDYYVCGVCGLAVTVDEACGCVDFCDIICCCSTN